MGQFCLEGRCSRVMEELCFSCWYSVYPENKTLIFCLRVLSCMLRNWERQLYFSIFSLQATPTVRLHTSLLQNSGFFDVCFLHRKAFSIWKFCDWDILLTPSPQSSSYHQLLCPPAICSILITHYNLSL